MFKVQTSFHLQLHAPCYSQPCLFSRATVISCPPPPSFESLFQVETRARHQTQPEKNLSTFPWGDDHHVQDLSRCISLSVYRRRSRDDSSASFLKTSLREEAKYREQSVYPLSSWIKTAGNQRGTASGYGPR